MPASLVGAAAPPRKFYPRAVRIDTVDAQAVAWLRAGVAKYYPAILNGPTPFLFVSLFVDDRGTLVRAATGPKAADLDAGYALGRLYIESSLRYGGDSVGPARPEIVAERTQFENDEKMFFAGMDPTRSVMGSQTVFPAAFDYDTAQGASIFDPFLGADPHAMQWDDDLFLHPGMIGPGSVEVHVLRFKPGRGTASDFGPPVHLDTRERIARVSPADTAAYLTLGPAAVAEIARCRPPACRPYILRGPAAGELSAGLDSASAPSTEPMWHASPNAPVQDLSHSPLTQSDWDMLSRKPLVLVDGVRTEFATMLALGQASRIAGYRTLSPAEAMKISHDPAAANGAIVATTTAHAGAR